MPLTTVFLQPIGASPTPGVEADSAVPGMPAAPVADPAAPATTSAVSQELCEKANSEALVAAGGYALGAVILGVVVYVLMKRKHASTPTGQTVTAVAIATVLGLGLTFVDPAKGDQYLLCLNDPATATYLFFGTQPFARALVVALAAMVITFGLSKIAKRMV